MTKSLFIQKNSRSEKKVNKAKYKKEAHGMDKSDNFLIYAEIFWVKYASIWIYMDLTKYFVYI